jgi:hypothetical protein
MPESAKTPVTAAAVAVVTVGVAILPGTRSGAGKSDATSPGKQPEPVAAPRAMVSEQPGRGSTVIDNAADGSIGPA